MFEGTQGAALIIYIKQACSDAKSDRADSQSAQLEGTFVYGQKLFTLGSELLAKFAQTGFFLRAVNGVQGWPMQANRQHKEEEQKVAWCRCGGRLVASTIFPQKPCS